MVFRPNNHSESRIQFRPVHLALEQRLRSIARMFGIENAASIEQVAETEVNSNNFKVCGERSTIILRRNISLQKQEQIALEVELLEYLVEHSVRVARPLRVTVPGASLGAFAIESSEGYFTAFDYISGDHFSGDPLQLPSAAQELKKLHQALAVAPIAGRISASFQALGDTIRPQALDEILTCVDSSVPSGQALDAEVRATLKERGPMLRALIPTVLTQLGEHHAQAQLIHGDLHPHNFIFGGTELRAIIDFGEMRQGLLLEDIAYALHRLGRQVVIYQHISDPIRIVEKLRESIKHFVTAYDLDTAALPFVPCMIKHIALKKIVRILSEHFLYNNQRWSYDLSKQLSFLDEAILFERAIAQT